MSDLISRSALIKVLKDRATNEAIMGYMTAYDVTNSIIDEVEEQPTAFDADKVILGLEKELSLTDKEKERCVGENNLQFDSAKGYASGISTAIEIVKQGGVSDDVCEWKNEDEEANLYVTGCGQRHLIFEGTPKENGYTYCQYCSKKIKVVE